MNSKYSLLELQAPLPYIRLKPDYEPDTIKYTFERQHRSTKQIVSTDATDRETTRTEDTTTLKERTVELKCYGGSSYEDNEHFFEALDRLLKHLRLEYVDANEFETDEGDAGEVEADIFFAAMDMMLTGNAHMAWRSIVAKEDDTNFNTFKRCVAQFIEESVVGTDAYHRQVQYLTERAKPSSLTAVEWYQRLRTLNRYVAYLFPTIEKLRLLHEQALFAEWWHTGQIHDYQVRRIILMKAPTTWQEELRKSDVSRVLQDEKPIDDIIKWYTVVETAEKKTTSMRRGQGSRYDRKDRDRRTQSRRNSRKDSGSYRRDDSRRPSRNTHGSDRYGRDKRDGRNDRSDRRSRDGRYQDNRRDNYRDKNKFRRQPNGGRRYDGDRRDGQRDDRGSRSGGSNRYERSNRREEHHHQESDDDSRGLNEAFSSQFNIQSDHSSDYDSDHHYNSDYSYSTNGSEDSRASR
mgnify:CR=1 FL=1